MRSDVLDAYRAALREATEACTIVTNMITGRPARYIRNRLPTTLSLLAWSRSISCAAESDGAAQRKRRPGGNRTQLFAGQSVALAKDTTAAALVESLAEETSRRLQAFRS